MHVIEILLSALKIELVLAVLKISIMLSVFSLGLKSTFSDAAYLFRQPQQLGRALLSMHLVMPLAAVVLGMTFQLKPPVKIALVALAVSPISPLLPKKALKAGGSEVYAIGLSVATAVLAIIVIPATMKVIAGIVRVPLEMPVRSVAVVVLATVLIPLLAGMCVRRLEPGFAEKVATPVGVLGAMLLILGVLPVLFVTARPMMSLIGDGTLLSIGGFALVGIIAGHLLGGPDPESRHFLSLGTASRHPAMAAMIAHVNFPEQKLAVPAIALYLIVCGLLSSLLSAYRTPVKGGSAPMPTPSDRTQIS